jgi:hypothetical protein
MVSSPGVGGRYRYRGITPNPEQFHQDLWSRVLCQYVITRRNSDEPVGLVSAFNGELLDGHAHLGVCLDPRVQGRGWPMEGVGLFVEHLFTEFGLRKLYLQIDAGVVPRVRSLTRDLLAPEVRLAGYHGYGGERRDSVIYALWRERWFDASNRHRNLLRRHLAVGDERPFAEMTLSSGREAVLEL